MLSRSHVLVYLFVFSLGIACLPAAGQKVIAKVPVENSPSVLAVNPTTNMTYVALSYPGQNIAVIDGADYSAKSVAVGLYPFGITVDPVRNKIYVAGYNDVRRGVVVIDGSTLQTTFVPGGYGASYVAVNTVTNVIYLVNSGESSITVIDGATLSTTTVPLPPSSTPRALAVNEITNKTYVVETNNNSVAVLDGKTLSVTPVSVGENPMALAINQSTNKIFVANFKYGYGATVTVIDGSTLSTQTVNVSVGPWDIAVNITTNQAYTSDSLEQGVLTVIDGATLSTLEVPAGFGPEWLAVDELRNKIYVTNAAGPQNTVTVIDSNTYNSKTVEVGISPVSLATNKVSNRTYVSVGYEKAVAVIAGLVTLSVSKVGAGSVNSSDGYIRCGRACSNDYDTGAQVLLIANPDPGSTLTGWTGCDTLQGANQCRVTTNDTRAVTASFETTQIGLNSLSFTPSTLRAGGVSIGTLLLASAAPSGGFTVALQSDNLAVNVPPTLYIPGGRTSMQFMARTFHVRSKTVVHVTAAANSARASATLTINP